MVSLIPSASSRKNLSQEGLHPLPGERLGVDISGHRSFGASKGSLQSPQERVAKLDVRGGAMN